MIERTIICAVIIIMMFYCVPMMKRMDELENRIAKIKEQLDRIEKALYVMPDDGGDAE